MSDESNSRNRRRQLMDRVEDAFLDVLRQVNELPFPEFRGRLEAVVGETVEVSRDDLACRVYIKKTFHEDLFRSAVLNNEPASTVMRLLEDVVDQALSEDDTVAMFASTVLVRYGSKYLKPRLNELLQEYEERTMHKAKRYQSSLDALRKFRR
jgi:hypothetical protein